MRSAKPIAFKVLILLLIFLYLFIFPLIRRVWPGVIHSRQAKGSGRNGTYLRRNAMKYI